MAVPKRLGRQTPTASVVLPYTQTHGQEAVDLYEKTGRKAMDWQRLLIYDMLAYNSEDLWVHSKFGYAVPRRNGKNEVVVMRELYGLMNGETILHTAHRTPTSSSAFQRLYDALTACGYKEKEDFDSYRQYGLERIEMRGSKGKCSFRTRTSKGGLGEGFDLLVIDEAQEYQDDQETTLKYVISSSQNPQTLLCGTPPTPVSSGTVFMNLRKAIFSGDKKDACWEEWSVDHLADVHDVDAWYETNPSLGTILTERIIADEIGTNELDFNIQRLGYWTIQNLRSAISENQWNELRVDTVPELKGPLYVGIKIGADGQNIAMSIAVKTKNDKVFVETIDCQPHRNGDGWILSFLKQADWQVCVIDGSNGQQALADDMRTERLKVPYFPRVGDVIAADEAWQSGIDQGLICHMGQASLSQSVTNCDKRLIGSNGGFGYKSIKEGVDIALMESAIFAYWAAKTTKERRKRQQVVY